MLPIGKNDNGNRGWIPDEDMLNETEKILNSYKILLKSGVTTHFV